MTGAPDLPDGGPRLLLGAPIASEIRARVANDVIAFRDEHGYAPALAVVVVGKDAPSAVYLHKILDGCRKVGIEDRLVELGADATEADIGAALRALQADPHVAGIITQMPLPPGIPLRGVINVLDPLRDIDGIHPLNAGLLALGYEGFLPATAHAAVEILLRSGSSSRVPTRSSSAGPTSSASLRPCCCSARTPPSRSATPEPGTWRPSSAPRTWSSSPSGARG
jgi:hypothetical protein